MSGKILNFSHLDVLELPLCYKEKFIEWFWEW